MSKARPTATLLSRIRRAAKKSASAGTSHTQALDAGAREAGYSDWHALRQAHVSAQGSSPRPAPTLPIDPKLPARFDSTPNELRSDSQLRRWWDRPFALTRAEGKLEVRCLDGGAHDRSTWYGLADSPEAAALLAAAKLKNWQEARAALIVCVPAIGYLQLVRLPQRPRGPEEILATLRIPASGPELSGYLRQAVTAGWTTGPRPATLPSDFPLVLAKDGVFEWRPTPL